MLEDTKHPCDLVIPLLYLGFIKALDALGVLVEGGAPIGTSRNAYTLSHISLTIVASENGAGGLTAARPGETDGSDGFADRQTWRGSAESSIAA